MTATASQTFSKRERIVSRKLMEQLFAKGSSMSASAFPLRIVYQPTQRNEVPVQILVSVSKRHFKHAVDRNRAKRQIREAYRHHKQVLTERIPADTTLAAAFIWLSDKPCDSSQVSRSMGRLLEKVADSVASV